MKEESIGRFRKLLDGGESETVEFKQNMNDEAIETIGAFANARGGTILIGVADDGRVRGVTFGGETLRDWANRIAQAVRVHPKIKLITYKGRSVAEIQVSESAVKPVSCRGKYLIRVGKSNRQMTDDDLTRAILGKLGLTWDEGVEQRATINDLNPVQLQRFRILCNKKGRRPIPPEDDDRTVLEKLGLSRDERLLRAALLLFGKEPQRFYASAKVKIGRFRSPTFIIDDREVLGTLFDQVEGTMGYFREHLQTRFEFTGEPAREVIWEYPLEALREAIINAICHRDYLDVGNTQVRWYDEQLVILNPGGLPSPLRLEDLKRAHRSMPHNHKIAEMFFYAGLIEQWGSGIEKIFNQCTLAGLPDPEFNETQGALWVTFRKDILTEAYLLSLGLNERQIRAVEYVKKRGEITNREYQELNHISKPSATRDLADMVVKRILFVSGKGKRSIRYVFHEPKMSQK